MMWSLRRDIFSLGEDGVFRALLNKPRRCRCGRMAYFVVNRDGKSRCMECDREYLEALSRCRKSA